MKRCPACGEENADRARFCHSCATPLLDAEGFERKGVVPAVARIRERLAELEIR